MFIEPPKLKGLTFQAASSWLQTVVNEYPLGSLASCCSAFSRLPGVSAPAGSVQGFEGNFCTDLGLLSVWLPLFQTSPIISKHFTAPHASL